MLCVVSQLVCYLSVWRASRLDQIPLCASLATGLHSAPLTVGCSSLNVCQWVLLVTVW